MFSELQTRFFQRFLPVGTIVASVVKPEQFGVFSGSPLWAVADGRDVPGTAYERAAGTSRVPDLRGLFLRGMNTMVEGEPRTDDYADPDGNRAAGTAQGDQLRSHQHGLQTKISPFAQGGGNPNFNSAIFHEGGFNSGALPGVLESGGVETRPKNIAVYYYVKIN